LLCGSMTEIHFMLQCQGLINYRTTLVRFSKHLFIVERIALLMEQIMEQNENAPITL
jgi:hypothetical protein